MEQNNPQLMTYIKENMNMYSKEAIENQLKNNGFTQEQINSAYEEVNMGNQNIQAPIGEMEYATIGSRFIAVLIDGIIIFVIAFIFSFIALLISPFLSILAFFIYPLYEIYFIGIKGATPGKKAMGIKVVNERNEVIGIGSSIFRYIMKFVSGLIFMIGYIIAIWHPKKQALHDRVVKTYVILDK